MIVAYDFATPLYAQAVALRHSVLRVPLSRNIADDDLAAEWSQTHFAALDDGLLIGTASLLRTGSELKMRQVAVDPQWHGRGVGRALVGACEAEAQTYDGVTLYCHARLSAKEFYERCGWEARGGEFEEVGIPHVKMVAPSSSGVR